MVLWGVPGTGKSHFARWQVANRNYVHAATDDVGIDRALQVVSAALQEGRPAIIEWGVYIGRSAIENVRHWRDQGADPWWFDGDPREAAFDAWKLENKRKSRPFTNDKWHEVVGHIALNWHLIEEFFGRDRIVYTVRRRPDGGPVHLTGKEIEVLMNERRRGQNPGRGAPMTQSLNDFAWNIADNLLELSDQQRMCARFALSQLMGWAVGSPEALAIPSGPPATDLKRLVEERPELGLVWHGQGDPDVPGNSRGIIIGEVQTPYGNSGHAEFADQIGLKAEMFVSIMGVITKR